MAGPTLNLCEALALSPSTKTNPRGKQTAGYLDVRQQLPASCYEGLSREGGGFRKDSKRAGGCSPPLIGLDLLLDVLPIGTLRSLLGHSHQLDQLRPG